MQFLTNSKKIAGVLLTLGISSAAFAAPLSGTYTIGGTTPNYATLSDAVTALNTEGISGPVTFNIRNGVYNATTWRAEIKTITGASATKRITFKSETNNAANVTIRVDGTATATNYVLKLNGASFITIKDLTFRNEGATYGRAIELAGTSGNDSLINCRLESITRTTASTNTSLIYATSLKGDNNVFVGNTFLNNSYGIYYYGTSTTVKVANARFLNNTFTNQYGHAFESYYTDNLRFNGNVITTNSTGTFYGLEVYYADGAAEITGNTISGYSNGYGIAHYYSDGDGTNYGLVANNVIYNIGGTGTSRGISSHYTSYQRYYNNTIRMAGTSATASIPGYFYYSNNVDYVNNEIRNNVFANFGGGYAIYVYNPSYNSNTFDYNNLYTTGTRLVDQGTPSTDYAKLTNWRQAFGHDANSISYDPAFTAPTNLVPDAGNPASWSLNGRGVHLAGNNKDFNGNARVTTLATGVPDIGAFEFTPTSTPPAATATPAAPAAGTTQVFTFGEDTVAAISWTAASTVPSAITVRQYTGTLPAGINAVSPTSMYFYTDIAAPGTFSHTTDIYYKEPWMGTTAAEVALRLAKKDGTNPWAAYAPATSGAIPERNLISTTGLTDFGLFTGIDIADNAGTAGLIGPSGYICSGTYPIKVRVRNNGNNTINNVQLQWEVNGVAQSSVSYSTPLASKAEVVVTLGNVTFSNAPLKVKAWTASPNGVVDPISIDDTSSVTLRDGLNGTYTIGGTNPSYPNFVDAVKDLNDFGICGPVTFNIRNGSYNGNAILNKINGASATNRVTFQSESANANNVNINYTASVAATNYVLQLNNASYVTLKDLTFTAGGTTQARVLQFVDGTSFDSVLNCRLVGPVLTTASTNTSLLFGEDITGTKLTFMDNTFLNGSYGAYLRGTSATSLIDGVIFNRNTFENQFTYAAYPYYVKDLKFTNNVVSTNSTDNTFYGIYTGYCDGALEITRNKVMGLQGGYGMYVYFCDATAGTRGVVANNTISMGAGTNTSYGLRIYTCNYQNVYNNSVNIISGSATSYAGYVYSSSTSAVNNEIRNNVFANQGIGYALYVYNPTYNTSDYNNLYTAGVNLVDRGTPAADFTTLQAWRTASSQELNSIAYDPGFANAQDLHPDPAKPASWSLNGRGVHIASNNLDMDNNPRITSLADGVPDIGAYEFTPNSIPPAAVATPATPAPGTKQVYTFGQDTVAVIDWKANSVMPNFIEIRQYSGEKAPQYTKPAFMYFHTDVNTQSVTHNFDADIYYKDTWRGTTATESNLRMMKKLGSNPWTAFNGTESSVNTARNTISAPQLSSFGVFTGGNDGDIFSANIKPATTTVFCPGGSATLNATTGTGYSYQWEYNGSPIPGATSSTLVATTAGDYTVTITDNVNNKTATSDKVAITIISAPSAQISASGALTYCPGTSLSLSTPVVPGITYQWQLNGSSITGATAATHQVSAAGQYTVLVNNIACSALSPVVTVSAGPLQLSIGNDTAFCESPTATLVLDAGHTGANYTWNTGAATQQIAANTSGKYWVTVDAGAGCVATDTIQVTVNPLPSVSGISYNRSGNTFQFSANGVMNANSYLWIFNDGVTSGAQAPSHTFTIQPTDVKLIVTNDCGSDTIALNFSTTGVNDVNKDKLVLNLYPNPASDKITLQAEGTFVLQNIAVVNQLGQVVMKEELTGGVKTKTVDVSNLPVGYYILRAGTSDGVIAKPFNITR